MISEEVLRAAGKVPARYTVIGQERRSVPSEKMNALQRRSPMCDSSGFGVWSLNLILFGVRDLECNVTNIELGKI